jgi:hypothetical protein
MSRNIIFVVMYLRHKLLDLTYEYFVFIVVGCPLLLFFVYCVLIECVVTSCNMCYLSVVSLLYYCHRAKAQLQSNK